MFKLLKFISSVILSFFALNAFSQIVDSANYKSSKKILFKFDLKNEALTSAGVYKKDGTLLRTLWGGVKYKAGTNTAKWDGLDDRVNLLLIVK